MTLATISNRKIRRQTVASPATYGDIEEVTEISGFGAVAEIVEATNFDSAGTKEYIAGLLDGVEFSITCNDIPAATNQVALKAAQATTIAMQYAKTDSSPELTQNFSAVVLGYEDAPSVSEQNRITFTFKITGAIT